MQQVLLAVTTLYSWHVFGMIHRVRYGVYRIAYSAACTHRCSASMISHLPVVNPNATCCCLYLNTAGIQPAPARDGEASAAPPPALTRDTATVVNAPTTAPISTSNSIPPVDADADADAADPLEPLAAAAEGVFVFWQTKRRSRVGRRQSEQQQRQES